MKYLFIFLKVILYIIATLILIIGISLMLDAKNTRFLHINKNDPSIINEYVIKNVNILPMTSDTVLYNKMIHIKDGKIVSIDDSIYHGQFQVFSGNGNFLMPGLIDMHVHVWDSYELALYLVNGVTSLRNLWGMPMHLRIKDKIKQGKLKAPFFLTSGPKLTGPEFIGDDNTNLHSTKEARQKIRNYRKRKYDFIKTYYGLPMDMFDAIIDQSEKEEMDIIAHPSQKVDYSYHFNPQIKSVEHTEDIVQQALQYQLDSTKLVRVIDDFREANHSSHCPTLSAFYNILTMMVREDILSNDSIAYMNPLIKMLDSKAQVDRWQNSQKIDSTTIERIQEQHEFHLYIIQQLHAAGVNIICGTDAGIGITLPGYSIHLELELYKQAGLSNYEVLRTATVNPSIVHKELNDLGSLEAGNRANMILLNGNPLEDLSVLKSPNTVFANGKRYDHEELNQLEDLAKNRKNKLVTLLNYLEFKLVE